MDSNLIANCLFLFFIFMVNISYLISLGKHGKPNKCQNKHKHILLGGVKKKRIFNWNLYLLILYQTHGIFFCYKNINFHRNHPRWEEMEMFNEMKVNSNDFQVKFSSNTKLTELTLRKNFHHPSFYLLKEKKPTVSRRMNGICCLLCTHEHRIRRVSTSHTHTQSLLLLPSIRKFMHNFCILHTLMERKREKEWEHFCVSYKPEHSNSTPYNVHIEYPVRKFSPFLWLHLFEFYFLLLLLFYSINSKSVFFFARS